MSFGLFPYIKSLIIINTFIVFKLCHALFYAPFVYEFI